MKTLLIAALVLAWPLHAQQLPTAPRPHVDRAETALLAADAASRALDVYSTHLDWLHQQACDCNHETMLPAAIAHHVPAMAAYSGATVALDWWVARRLAAHHPRLAHLYTSIDIAQDAPWAISNLFVDRWTAPENRPTVQKR